MLPVPTVTLCVINVPAVAQLFMWEWQKAGAGPSDISDPAERAWSPIVVHKTRRSLRAVHFHPHGAPLMLTAEVLSIPCISRSRFSLFLQ